MHLLSLAFLKLRYSTDLISTLKYIAAERIENLHTGTTSRWILL